MISTRKRVDIIGATRKHLTMKTALTIAGSDSCGGAGIQADIKTMTMNGVFAMSAVTALTAQNTLGVTGIQESTPEFLALQLDAVFTDIFPDAVKIGMVSSTELIRVIAEKLRQYQARHVVVDPVMVATSGSSLLKSDAVRAMTEELFPLAEVITPNIPEAEVLSGERIQSEADMEKAAAAISKKYGCAVLLKGGHSINDANDVLYQNGNIVWFKGKRIDNPNTHGTGCTLSSAIASNLAKGFNLTTSVERAKSYLSGALQAQLNLGAGSGPMKHNYLLRNRFAECADGMEE
jgi:hydroxymethylpyrimidine/phosphomethylpyrimidine kinase